MCALHRQYKDSVQAGFVFFLLLTTCYKPYLLAYDMQYFVATLFIKISHAGISQLYLFLFLPRPLSGH